ncbi:MAG TPA: hypothetical protein VII58_10315 [Acidobacteriaceae bacterium]
MTTIQRRRLVTFAIVTFALGELLIAAMNLLQGETVARVLLVNGVSLVTLVGCLLYLRNGIRDPEDHNDNTGG